MASLCRLCLNKCKVTYNIFNYQNGELHVQIKECTTIEVSNDENACGKCINMIKKFHAFRKLCLESNRLINKNSAFESSDEESDSADSSSQSDYDVQQNTKFIENSAVLEKINPVEKYDTIKSIIGNNTYSCDICEEQFTSFFDYQDHQVTHNGNPVFKCDKCDDTFSSRQCLVEHDSRHKVPCHVCNLKILRKSMAAHLLLHSDVHRCAHCGLRNTSNASLVKHIKARHKGVKGFVCYICGKQNSCQSSMKRHMAYHSTERPHKCKYCNFSAKSLNIVQVHTSRIHLAEICVCEICAKFFKSRPSLNQHIKRVHNDHSIVCNICNKSFMENYHLKRHMKKHMGQRLYECKLCEKEFLTVSKLKEHMHSHRKGCVNCPRCDKEFYYKKYYEKHLLKCMGVDPSSDTDGITFRAWF